MFLRRIEPYVSIRNKLKDRLLQKVIYAFDILISSFGIVVNATERSNENVHCSRHYLKMDKMVTEALKFFFFTSRAHRL